MARAPHCVTTMPVHLPEFEAGEALSPDHEGNPQHYPVFNAFGTAMRLRVILHRGSLEAGDIPAIFAALHLIEDARLRGVVMARGPAKEVEVMAFMPLKAGHPCAAVFRETNGRLVTFFGDTPLQATRKAKSYLRSRGLLRDDTSPKEATNAG